MGATNQLSNNRWQILFAVLYAILTLHLSDYGNNNTLEEVAMALDQMQYLYAVELTALEEQLGQSLDRVARIREKAVKRNDFKAADRINGIQRGFDLVQRRILRLK
jgi:hypothetical protein